MHIKWQLIESLNFKNGVSNGCRNLSCQLHLSRIILFFCYNADSGCKEQTCVFLFFTKNWYQWSTSTRPSWHLLVQSQQWKHQNIVWNLFNVNNKDNSGIFTVDFEQMPHIVLVSLLALMLIWHVSNVPLIK